MDHAAPAIFQALEGSAFGAGIRQSIWLYPLANVGHVVAVVVFFASVAVMDERLAGGLSALAPAAVLRGARRAAMVAFAFVAITGSMLFAAEASHLALNPVFLTKVGLIALGLANIAFFEFALKRQVLLSPAAAPLPTAVRASAFASLAVWLAVVACGRSIAYF
jgi:hypothetical protein